MCIIVGAPDALKSIAATSIFARAFDDGRQSLVYSMHVTAVEPVAMVLPVPVPAQAAEDALEFVDLEAYPTFFEDVNKAFPEPVAGGIDIRDLMSSVQPQAALVVHEVGSFVASFVPSRADFGRLDERFQIADHAWDALPDYAGWGFAVFQLAPTSSTIHPMAFVFPRRDPSRLFFPTVHVHDGAVHEMADFDHRLFAQPVLGQTVPGWRASLGLMNAFVDPERAKGVINGALPCFTQRLVGTMQNQDTYALTVPVE